jgi:alpha-galactosidase
MTAPPTVLGQNKPRAPVRFASKDFPVTELGNPAWQTAKPILVKKYWSGRNAPKGRRFEARILWSETALYIRFDAAQAEPLVVSESPVTDKETFGLWDRDVCELFLAPDEKEFRKYFEFEIAPTGEWLDLGIHQKPEHRVTDRDYNSGMKTAAEIGKDRVVMALKIEWKAFGKKPSAGDIWVGNLYRAVGEGATRGHLAWSPTESRTPNFHVPDKFGEFEFTGE